MKPLTAEALALALNAAAADYTDCSPTLPMFARTLAGYLLSPARAQQTVLRQEAAERRRESDPLFGGW